jgi:hypothetical protein
MIGRTKAPANFQQEGSGRKQSANEETRHYFPCSFKSSPEFG